MIQINTNTYIDENEITYSAARSSGPGGQNVNKVSTKVILSFNVTGSPNLSDEQKKLLFEKLGNRINKEGVLLLASQERRSQFANKLDVLEKFVELLNGALYTNKHRRKTHIPKAAKFKRLEFKKQRGEIKKNRTRIDFSD